MYNFKSMRNDSHGHELFAVVAAVHHQGVCQALDDGALGFAESLDGVAASGVGYIDRGADLDVVAVGKVWLAGLSQLHLFLSPRSPSDSVFARPSDCYRIFWREHDGRT